MKLYVPLRDRDLLDSFREVLRDELNRIRPLLQIRLYEQEQSHACCFMIESKMEACTVQVYEGLPCAIARAVGAYLAWKEERYIGRLVCSHPAYERVQEKGGLLGYVLYHLAGREVGQIASRASELTSDVERMVFDYFQQEQDLHLDGFFRFRMKAKLCQLRLMVDMYIEEYFAEEEYEMVVRRLRAFLASQTVRTELLRVVHEGGTSFRYYNEEWERLDPSLKLAFPAETELPYVSEEADIVRTLAAFAPGTLFVYTEQPRAPIIMMLTRLFAGRIIVSGEYPLVSMVEDT
ncbi:sporulation protein YtxC [Aneurinibacillus uraniidurans]|uniref:sporulation protein YtxC n=1 Tax=Aneurinibacillus uraniidurans TaxID=2966586 RepID=UPI00234ACA1D|nr:sporulation protein YtxC [Aneurinibacillus sp. B1]WCN39766.1 sporulation protein YtxC [Aneurinibacillus sp. B1]